jgi:hypothetical protein
MVTGMPGVAPEPLASPAVGVTMPGSVPQMPGPAMAPPATSVEYDAYLDDEEWRLEGRWRWLMTALLVLGLAGFIVNQETYAATTFIVRNPNSAFQTGYVELAVDRANTWLISASDLMPGESAASSLVLVNTGTEDIGMIRVTSESDLQPPPVLLSDLTNGLQISYDRCTEEWSKSTPSTCPGQQTLNFFTCKAVSDRVLIGYPGQSLPPGGKDFVRVRITLPETAGREFMGLAAGLKFTFTASQEPAPLTPETCSLLTPTPAATSTRAPTPTSVPGAGGTVTFTATPTVFRTVTPIGAHGDPNTPVPATRTYGAGTPSPTVTPIPALATVPTSTPIGAHGDPATPGPPPPTPSPFLGFRASPTPSVLHMKSVPSESADGVLP